LSQKRSLSRVLVTGGAGFIGSHLCRRLLGEGVDVLAYDNLLTGRVENITDLLGHERFTFLHYDVTTCTSTGRSTRSCTSRRRPAPRTSSACRSRS